MSGRPWSSIHINKWRTTLIDNCKRYGFPQQLCYSVSTSPNGRSVWLWVSAGKWYTERTGFSLEAGKSSLPSIANIGKAAFRWYGPLDGAVLTPDGAPFLFLSPVQPPHPSIVEVHYLKLCFVLIPLSSPNQGQHCLSTLPKANPPTLLEELFSSLILGTNAIARALYMKREE